MVAEALSQIHAVPIEGCAFMADWNQRVREAERRLQAGLIDQSDFDEENRARSAESILKELQSFSPLPTYVVLHMAMPPLRIFSHTMES